MAVLAAEASTQEAAAARDGATLRIREAEDRVAVAELEASEWESQAEAEHSAALASAHADTEGLTLRITLLKGELEEERRAWETFEMEHWACFEELTLLQTQGYELCHAIIGAPQAQHLSEGMRHTALWHTKVAEELATF
jgi:hypothetical protein